MALLPNVFIPDEADANPFPLIEEGWHEAEITKNELKTTKAKGKMTVFRFTAESEKGEQIYIYHNLNLVCKSNIAVRIARADLYKICEAAGHEGELEDADDLMDIPMAVRVVRIPETSQYPAKNEIKDFKHIDQLEELQEES